MNLLALVVKPEVKFHPCTLYKLFFLQDQFCDLDDARIIVFFLIFSMQGVLFHSFVASVATSIGVCQARQVVSFVGKMLRLVDYPPTCV